MEIGQVRAQSGVPLDNARTKMGVSPSLAIKDEDAGAQHAQVIATVVQQLELMFTLTENVSISQSREHIMYILPVGIMLIPTMPVAGSTDMLPPGENRQVLQVQPSL